MNNKENFVADVKDINNNWCRKSSARTWLINQHITIYLIMIMNHSRRRIQSY